MNKNPICKIIGCGEKVLSSGLCKRHYEQLRRGRLQQRLQFLDRIEHLLSSRRAGKCSIYGCQNSVFLRGLCVSHFNNAIKTGKITDVKRAKTCRFAGCQNQADESGFCNQHKEFIGNIRQEETVSERAIQRKIRGFPVKAVPLSMIDEDDTTYMIRWKVEEQSTINLASSIAEIGLIHPVLLAEKDKGRYRIVSGFCRIRAIKMLAKGNQNYPVPARIIPKGALDDVEMFKIAIDENLRRNLISHLEIALRIQKIKFQRGYTDRQIANLFGVPLERVYIYSTILKKATDKVLKALHEGIITVSHVRLLMRLSGKRQDRLLDIIISKRLSRRDIESYLQKEVILSQRQQVEEFIKNPPEGFSINQKRGTYTIKITLKGIANVRRFYHNFVKDFLRTKKKRPSRDLTVEA
jgi:ParB family chromosome partitioning protein